MFNMKKKEVAAATDQNAELLKKLGDALAVLTKVDDAQQRQIGDLQRALNSEKDGKKKAKAYEIAVLERENYFLTEENERLKEKLELLMRGDVPKEFEQDMSRGSMPNRIVNVFRNFNCHTYLDVINITASEFLRQPTVGKVSLREFKEHLKNAFPNNYTKFAVFGGDE